VANGNGNGHKRNKGGHGWPKGKPRPTTAKRTAANRANARKPRVKYSAKQLKRVREFGRDKVLDFLLGPAYQRQQLVALYGTDADSTRAYGELCDRFNLPKKSVQDVNASVRQAPQVQVTEIQHARECACWRREECDCGARERAEASVPVAAAVTNGVGH